VPNVISIKPFGRDTESIRKKGMLLDYKATYLLIRSAMSSNGTKKSLCVDVISEQPLLQVKSFSLQNGTIMLFDGERYVFCSFLSGINCVRTTVTLEVENIGKITINHLSLSFKEESENMSKKLADLNAAEKYEMEYYGATKQVFMWINKPTPGFQVDKVLQRGVVDLPCRKTHKIIIEIFGKRGW
jgi:hypothetical protein